MTRKTTSRRGFLGAVAASAAAPLVVPRSVLGMGGRPGANDRIVTGHIGVGGMGGGHLRALADHTAAICDVDRPRLEERAAMFTRPVALYTDYRELLERKDIDAVVIATPDHWHGVMTVHACEAGKDVYVEKPACKTIEEGRAMVDAARRFARVVQVGSQGRSQPGAYAACQYIWNGQLGDVQRVDCWHYENPVGGDPAKTGAPPAGLDWDKWLGPAAWRPYNPDIVHFNFRWILDFGGGQIRDRGAHVLSLVSWFLGLDHTGPARVTAKGTPPATGMWDCPTFMEVTWEYDDPKLTVTWNQPGEAPVDAPFGAHYKGSEDDLVVRYGDGSGTRPDEKAMSYTPPADGPDIFRSPGHHANWLNCVKTREDPVMNIEAGHRVASMCVLGNIAYRLGRALEWDPATERFVGDEEANRMLSTPGRGPWRL